jgi:hypothetical protein
MILQQLDLRFAGSSGSELVGVPILTQIPIYCLNGAHPVFLALKQNKHDIIVLGEAEHLLVI